jgi:hypothetical protein
MASHVDVILFMRQFTFTEKYPQPVKIILIEAERILRHFTLSLHTSFASSTLMQALIHALLHFVLLTPSFKMFSIPSTHPILGLPRLLSPILSALKHIVR